MNIKVIGIGGIAGCMLEVLLRYLEHTYPHEATVTLIDGDGYEPKNEDRQRVLRFGNKAEVTQEHLQDLFPRVTVRARAEYLSEDNVVQFMREGDVVFVAVDNHKTRQLVSDRGEELEDVVVISGGNELTDGNVQVFVKEDGVNRTLPLANGYHPEIQRPTDKSPADIGCGALVESEPQLLFTNNLIAAFMLSSFYAYLQGALQYDEVYADLITANSRSVARSTRS